MGCLYWITGLAGAGKSTLANSLYHDLKKTQSDLVLLDGDHLREVYGLAGHFNLQDRKAMAMRHAKMCHLLTSQGIDVICPTISMFDAVRHWNRVHQADYVEIFLDVSQQTLMQRDQLKLYSQQSVSQPCYVVGQDIDAELPTRADVVLVNEGVAGIEPVYQQLLEFLATKDLHG